jgi:hypothetical protein
MKKGARSHCQRKQNFTRKKKKAETNSQKGITKLGFWFGSLGLFVCTTTSLEEKEKEKKKPIMNRIGKEIEEKNKPNLKLKYKFNVENCKHSKTNVLKC